MRQPSRIAVLVLAVLVSGVRSARGELIAMDRIPSSGDGRITRDTTTGLDWLDLTETLNQSLEEIQIHLYLSSLRGWRYATRAEVCGLFEPRTGPLCSSPAPPPREGVTELARLLGVTSSDGTTSLSQGIFAEGSGEAAVGIVYPDIPVAVIGTGSGGVPAGFGHFLVKAVPEPPHAALLALALGAVFLAATSPTSGRRSGGCAPRARPSCRPSRSRA